jgi:hypothetical protein
MLFYFFKIIFKISTLKRSKNIKKINKKNLNFEKILFQPRSQTRSKSNTQ